MRAVQCVEWGPPEKLVVADVEVPEPKPGEVRVASPRPASTSRTR